MSSANSAQKADEDFTSWLIEKAGGEKTAINEFRKYRLKTHKKNKNPKEIYIRDLIDLCEREGWMGWLKNMTVHEFVCVFYGQFSQLTPNNTVIDIKRQRTNLRKIATNETETETQQLIRLLMVEIKEKKVLTPETITKTLGQKSSSKIRRITNIMVEQKLIKPFGNRPFTFILANQEK